MMINKRYRRSKNNIKRALLIFMMLLFSSLVLTSCGEKEEKKKSPESVQDFSDGELKIGVVSGYYFGAEIKKLYPNAKIVDYYTREDAFKGLSIGEVDGFADDEPVLRARIRGDESIRMAQGYIEESEYSFIFQKSEKGERYSTEFSEYVEELKSDGELSALDEKWFGKGTENKTSEDYSALPDTNGKLTIAYEGNGIPFAYTSRDRAVGYDVDIAIGFCKKYGYGLEIVKTDFPDVMSGIKEGRYDAGIGGVTITESRKEDYCFGATVYEGGISICVRNDSEELEGGGAYDSFVRSFEKTFIERDRYKLFFKGIFTTLLITLVSVIFGTVLGIILYIYSKRGNRLVVFLIRLLTGLVHAVPVVMILMLIYFSFYNHMSIGGILASQSAFIIYFADEIYRMIVKNAKARKDDKLQEDYRLEYIDTREFFEILFKRKAMVVEDYKERIITLIKMTAVVGYVSTQDMTSVLNTIRMESMETMMPVIATTLCYIILILIITVILNRIGRKKPKEEAIQTEKSVEKEDKN